MAFEFGPETPPLTTPTEETNDLATTSKTTDKKTAVGGANGTVPAGPSQEYTVIAASDFPLSGVFIELQKPTWRCKVVYHSVDKCSHCDPVRTNLHCDTVRTRILKQIGFR
ncbi:hypothetical protein GCK72_009217 [Caenorhabditis remanei]|uniref:Uncharacterized protein n=1 Tax=Caenorhabditis remanei TaxID=31234 RepID=A0A6A5H2F0_CAERE|nr:hypothetical protein GCK72_009217 [Caenorhabditis remanei]KAF1760964.1 hypothetical protein GCK72_009217 [Caenorhabditis remanei]